MNFKQLQRKYDELREQFDAGEIKEEEFQEQIEGLQLKDEQGRFWTIGAQSGKWYRYDGRRWVRETPLPLTKHQGRGIPEAVSSGAAQRQAQPSVPRWLYTGCSGLVLLAVVAALIVGAVTILRGRDTVVRQEATPTLSLGVPANTPTLGPTPSSIPTVSPTDTPLALKLYSNSALGINLQYPGDWQTKETGQQVIFAPSDEGLSTSIISDTTVTDTVFVVGYQREGIADTPSELLSQLVTSLPTDASTVETGFRTVGSTRWALSQVSLNASHLPQEMTAYVGAASNEGIAYTVLAAAPATDWDTIAPLFEQMFDSFRFTSAPVAAVASTPGLTATTSLTTEGLSLVTATPSAEDTPQATSTPIIYVIEEGDTLGAIAVQYGVTVEAIQAANGIDDPTKIRAGQELIIPIGGLVPAGAEAATATPITSSASAEATSTPAPAPTPTPGPVALSGKILYPVFNPDRAVQGQPGIYDIWMSDPQGNNRQILVANASQPHLNSGGDLLAYRSWDPDSRGVAFLTISGGRQGVLTNFVEDGLPSWAPDSITMAFASRREGDRISRLYRVNQANSVEYPLGLLGEYVSSFPDGRLVFKGCTVEGACGMFVSGSEGGSQDLISDNTSDTAPAPSLDGSRIAFMSSGRDGGDYEIYVMDSNGGNVTRLTDNDANDGLPTWSPDGVTIAFASDRGGVWAIWAMNPDGSNQRKLFDMGGSPDGLVGFAGGVSRGWLEERISWSK